VILARWRRNRNARNLQAFFDTLAAVKAGRDGYSSMDRYRDCRTVFFGSEAGKRVLGQIIAMCEGLPVLEPEVSNHALLAFRAGRRSIGQELVKWMNAEPPAQQTQAESKR
jgi:hypothetical protein